MMQPFESSILLLSSVGLVPKVTILLALRFGNSEDSVVESLLLFEITTEAVFDLLLNPLLLHLDSVPGNFLDKSDVGVWRLISDGCCGPLNFFLGRNISRYTLYTYSDYILYMYR